MTLVTIVMPTFQRADYVRHAIDSALAQTFDDFALSIGDNSRTDEIQDVVCSYDDPRIVYHRNAEDIGGQANWLAIVDRAETPLVASLHDDDAWHPDFLAKVVPPMLEHPDVGMTFADFCVMDADGMPLPELTADLSIRTRRDCLDTGRLDLDRAAGLRLVAVWNAPQPAIAAVIRRESILRTAFPPETIPLYDIWISYQMVRRGEPFYFVQEPLTDYRWHDKQLTAEGFAGPEDEVFQRILDENDDAGPVLEEIRAYWSWLRWGRATALMTLRDHGHHRDRSREEFRNARFGLPLARRGFASVAGSSAAAWEALRVVAVARHELRARRSGSRA